MDNWFCFIYFVSSLMLFVAECRMFVVPIRCLEIRGTLSSLKKMFGHVMFMGHSFRMRVDPNRTSESRITRKWRPTIRTCGINIACNSSSAVLRTYTGRFMSTCHNWNQSWHSNFAESIKNQRFLKLKWIARIAAIDFQLS